MPGDQPSLHHLSTKHSVHDLSLWMDEIGITFYSKCNVLFLLCNKFSVNQQSFYYLISRIYI